MKRLLLLFSLLTAFAALAAERPNVLFILTEDQGAHMGALGTPGIATPHMDALAASGTLFRRAYVNYPVCSASKACLYTGLYPHNNGLRNNTNNFFKPAAKLTEAERNSPPYRHVQIRSTGPTLVEALQVAGYYSGVTGKLHVSPNERFPYDEFVARGPAQSLVAFAARSTALGRPWFFFHNSITHTHRPFVDSEKQPIGIDPAKVTLPAHLPDTPVARRDWAEYLDGVQRNDVRLGEALQALAATGQEAKTIVIFMGDHGPAFPHGKMTPYALGLQVPLVVRVPGGKAGQVRSELVQEIDLLPTLLDLLALPADPALPGRSLRPLIEDRPEARGHEFVFAEVTGRWLNEKTGVEERSVIGERYQLIARARPGEPRQINADLREWPVWRCRIYDEIVRVNEQHPEPFRILSEMDPARLGGRPPAIELYDLQSDPDELHNLAGDPAHRAELERLYAALQLWSAATADTTAPLPPLP